VGAVASEAQCQLGDDGSAGKPRKISTESGPRALDVEATEGVEITSGLGVQLRRALSEEVERTPEAPRRPPRATREHRPHPRLSHDETQDPRRLEIVEDVQDDGLGREEGHAER